MTVASLSPFTSTSTPTSWYMVYVTPEWVLLDFPQVHVGEPFCMSARCAYIIRSIAVHLPYREGVCVCWGGGGSGSG